MIEYKMIYNFMSIVGMKITYNIYTHIDAHKLNQSSSAFTYIKKYHNTNNPLAMANYSKYEKKNNKEPVNTIIISFYPILLLIRLTN